MRYQQRILKTLTLCVFAGVSALSSLFAEAIPFATSFESPEYSTGFLVSDPIWSFHSSILTAEITNVDALPGSGQSLLINGYGGFTFTATDPTSGLIRWVDFYLKPVFVEEADLLQSVSSLQSAVSAFVKNGSSGDVYVIDGNGQGSGVWVSAQRPLALSGSTSQDWVRLSYRLNYATQTWDLYIDDALALYDIGFLDDNFAALNSFSLKPDVNEITAFDYFYVGEATPASFLDTDQDGIFDSADANPNLADRYADADGDSISNIEEFRYGSSLTLRDSDADGLSDYLESVWMRNAILAETDLATLIADGLSGLFWQTLFELDEGYSLGALDGQLDWYASPDVAVTSDTLATATSTEDTVAYVERYFNTDSQSAVWFAFTGMFHTGSMPNASSITDPAAAVFGFSTSNTVEVLDVAGSSWQAYPLAYPADEWNGYAVHFDYNSKSWELYQNGQLIAENLSFADTNLDALSRFKASLEKSAGSDAASYLDLVQVYAGNDFDADGLGDDWERSFGFSPANEDSDGNDVVDTHEDPDFDTLTNIQEFFLGTNPTSALSQDGDTIPDDWEFFYEIDTTPGVDSSGNDTEPDGASDATEFSLDLNPTYRDHPDIELTLF